MQSTTIEFVNHASVIISYEKISILTDPWFNGSAFDNGWRLMHELQNKEISNILKKITHFIFHMSTLITLDLIFLQMKILKKF